MSAYRNFIQDYPSRCRRLLSQYSKDAEKNDLEVTLLLNIASSGIIVPYARLSEHAHPSGDAEQFADARHKFHAILDGRFLASELLSGSDPRSWRIGEIRELRGDPDAWNLDNLKTVTAKKTVRPIIKVLRNALAHGNVFSRGHTLITSLVFLSRVCDKKPEFGYEIITVTPPDLKDFVLAWLTMLARLDIPGQVFAEANLFAEIAA